MKKHIVLLSVFALFSSFAMPAVAQVADPQPDQPRAKAKPNFDDQIPDEEMAMARVMAEAGMNMIPAQLTKQYKLTDEQAESARQILQDNWKAFGKESQDKLLRTMILGRKLVQSGQAEPGDWQRLAKDGQPMIEQAVKFFNDSADQFEKVLDEDQRAKFAEEMMQFRAGQEMLLARAKLVADGEVKLDAKGQPEGGEAGWPAEAQMVRRGGQVQIVEEEVEEVGLDGAVRKVMVKRIKSKLPDEETVAGDERLWPAYLKGFIAKYDLREDQTKLARRMLGEALKRASETRTRMKRPFEDARKKIAEAEKGDDANAVAAAHLAYDQLNRPIVATFAEMKRQLENLLTAEQREAGKNRGELFGGKDQPAEVKDDPKAPAHSPAEKPKEPDTGGIKVHVIK